MQATSLRISCAFFALTFATRAVALAQHGGQQPSHYTLKWNGSLKEVLFN